MDTLRLMAREQVYELFPICAYTVYKPRTMQKEGKNGKIISVTKEFVKMLTKHSPI